MKNLFDAATATEIKERIVRLGPGSKRQWGKMSAAQAMAHCATTMEWAVGDSFAPRMFVGRILGSLVKSKVLRDDAPMKRNAPTAKSLVVADERDLRKERELLDKSSASIWVSICFDDAGTPDQASFLETSAALRRRADTTFVSTVGDRQVPQLESSVALSRRSSAQCLSKRDSARYRARGRMALDSAAEGIAGTSYWCDQSSPG